MAISTGYRRESCLGSLYTKHVRPAGGPREFGYGDTEFKVKWRFLEEDPHGSRTALGIAPKVFIPTASENRGLGDGVWRFQLPIQLGKTMGPWFNFAVPVPRTGVRLCDQRVYCRP